jgi:aryl-alcohol dehydrogenase-like predicted oxidoreductase
MDPETSEDPRYRRLGETGPMVSVIGVGSWWYGARDDNEIVATLRAAFELGVTLVDTADAYSRGHSEELVGQAITGNRDQVVVATKFGNVLDDQGRFGTVNGRPNYVKQACDASLRRLRVDTIDIYFQHRVDAFTPIEETVGAMSDLVAEGKVRHLGLSEAGARTIERAHSTYPIAAVQTEYSLISRDVEREVLPTTRRLGIGFVAYSPLGRALLTGAIRDADRDLASGDHRHRFPRFQRENLRRNVQLVDALGELALEKGCSLAQLAIAWVLAQGDDVIAIFGTKQRRFLEENLGARDVVLTEADLTRIDRLAPAGVASGDRYNPDGMSRIGL